MRDPGAPRGGVEEGRWSVYCDNWIKNERDEWVAQCATPELAQEIVAMRAALARSAPAAAPPLLDKCVCGRFKLDRDDWYVEDGSHQYHSRQSCSSSKPAGPPSGAQAGPPGRATTEPRAKSGPDGDDPAGEKDTRHAAFGEGWRAAIAAAATAAEHECVGVPNHERYPHPAYTGHRVAETIRALAPDALVGAPEQTAAAYEAEHPEASRSTDGDDPRDELIRVYEQYIAVLVESEGVAWPIALIHGMTVPPGLLGEGARHRADIARLRALLAVRDEGATRRAREAGGG